LICLGIGAFSLINGAIVKAILPVHWFNWINIKDEPLTEEQKKKSLHQSFRKSKTLGAQGSKIIRSQGSKIGFTRPITRVDSSHNQLKEPLINTAIN